MPSSRQIAPSPSSAATIGIAARTVSYLTTEAKLSLKSIPSLCKNPFMTRRALYLSISPSDVYVFLKTHRFVITFLSAGLSTRTQVLFSSSELALHVLPLSTQLSRQSPGLLQAFAVVNKASATFISAMFFLLAVEVIWSLNGYRSLSIGARGFL